MKIRNYKCTPAELARLLNLSSGYVDYLAKIGVVKIVAGKCLLCQSLREYFLSYLPPWDYGERVEEILSRLSTPPNVPASGLKCCWRLRKEISAATLRLHALEVVNSFNDCRPAIDAARHALANLQDWLTVEMELTRRFIRRAGLPAQIELILEARYVDCQNWASIQFYSQRHIYRLHRRGLNLIFCGGQVD